MSDKKALENGQKCLNCDCYQYCTMDSCILDIKEETPEFNYINSKGFEF